LPIYEYKCQDCGKTTEFLVGVGKDAVKVLCSHCGSRNVHKMVSQSFVARSGSIVGSQHGKTCCGRDERCSKPPCRDEGTCSRYE
jgi:putative FmdB family regulatory protein